MIHWTKLTSRERDAVVAEHVMELEETPRPCHYQDRYLINGKPSDVPNYTTDIKDAWTVKEAIHKLIFSKRQKFIRTIRDHFTLDNTMDLIHPEEWIFHVTPEILCIAALRAVGQEVII